MNKKVTYIIALCLLIFAAFLYALLQSSKKDNENTSSNQSTKREFIVIDDISNIEYQNQKYITTIQSSINGEKLNTYVDNNYYGLYTLEYGNNWNLYDNGNYVNYSGSLLAYSESLNLKLKKFSKGTIGETEKEEIINILGYQYLTELSNNEMVNIDLDNNGVMDKIVNVSNIDSFTEGVDEYFSIIYIVLNGEEKIILNSKIDVKDLYHAPLYNINYIWNMNNSSYDTLVFQKGFFSEVGDTVNVLFDYVENDYTIVFEG
jgi:hypothetical protein